MTLHTCCLPLTQRHTAAVNHHSQWRWRCNIYSTTWFVANLWTIFDIAHMFISIPVLLFCCLSIILLVPAFLWDSIMNDQKHFSNADLQLSLARDGDKPSTLQPGLYCIMSYWYVDKKDYICCMHTPSVFVSLCLSMRFNCKCSLWISFKCRLATPNYWRCQWTFTTATRLVLQYIILIHKIFAVNIMSTLSGGSESPLCSILLW